MRTFIVLSLIVALALFFRGYKAIERFAYAHDGDLYSWIVKDIVVNNHVRLIGQVTSTEGIFIGPFFYYLLVPFFILTSMEPTGGLILVGLISILTVISLYFAFNKLFGRTVGIIAAFLQAVLLTRVEHDRWVVPTNTTSLWEIWYFYTIMMLAKGKIQYLPILGFLAGLVWHINLSEAPILLVGLIALILGKKLPSLGIIIKTILALFIPLIPLALFELRHGFTQTKTLLLSFVSDQGGSTGWYKLQQVLSQISSNEMKLLFYPYGGNFPTNAIILLLFLLFASYLLRQRYIKKSFYLLVIIWFFSMVGFFSFSSKIISEYYFSNLDMIFLAILILFISYIFQKSTKGKLILSTLFVVILLRNLAITIGMDDSGHYGYLERKKVVHFLNEDSLVKGYPCIAINYITTPGNDSGFRYLLYLENLHIGKAGGKSPIYNIVVPSTLSNYEVTQRFGSIGIIPPKKVTNNDLIKESCSGANTNLTDPMLGYVE